ncbi:MAG: lytic transglycosylase domain-containing protein [Desulforhabdus sp.]|jgi:soluble lytic murein transglycosylase|nr:lytic transglycosylase domain-containing protein [Desulforhabdus sp.]
MIRYRKALIVTLSLNILAAVAFYFWKPGVLFSLPQYLFLSDSSYYDSYIRAVSKKHGIDFHLVKALIRAESKFNHLAVSPKGAMGLMQVMPATADHMGISDPFNPEENIEGGVRYLKWLMQVFDNDLNLALAAYNAGPTTVKRYGGVPPYSETRAYLKKVLKFYSEYKSNT